MKHEGYKIRDPYGVYFMTFATVQRVDVETVPDSLRFCIREKGLRLRPWCLMTNHVHLIVSAEKDDLPAIIRDFKKFTSSSVLKQIAENAEESCRDWMLWIFKGAGEKNSHNEKYQFWQQDNQQVQLESVRLR